MKKVTSNGLVIIGTMSLVMGLNSQASGQSVPFERTGSDVGRAPCADYTSTKKPHFGDLHVHTSYSYDSYISRQRNDPYDSYDFAQGAEIILPNQDGAQVVPVQLERPLDFMGVTDHAEFLGEMSVCTAPFPTSLAWFSPMCITMRSNIFLLQIIGAGLWQQVSESKMHASFCDLPGTNCEAGAAQFWQNIQDATDVAYDRSTDCSFTSFVAYEYTDSFDFASLHRNVIFRNEIVPALPANSFDFGANNPPALWASLRDNCKEAGTGCDVLAISHNANLARGVEFPDPVDTAQAALRVEYEPLVELTQHKASSECRFDRLAGIGVDTTDELCTFEQNTRADLASLGTFFGVAFSDLIGAGGGDVPIEEFERRAMVRNVLKDGMAIEDNYDGVNPFKLGFIGSTDTHSATGGDTQEENFSGHLGQRDAGFRAIQDHIQDHAGGLAVVWAEENSRDSLFVGMRNRETYATSGTRPVVRFFGGWNFGNSFCDKPNLVQKAYRRGVPMGSDLPPRVEDKDPRFVITVAKDAMSANIQRIQIIKGWVDANGDTQEKVADVLGDASQGNSVDTDSCAAETTGFTNACTVWRDRDFDPDEKAFYYARVVENATCRWSTHQCKAAGVDPFSPTCQEAAEAIGTYSDFEALFGGGPIYQNCCKKESEEPFYSPLVQERAWTSPIWYRP